MTEEKKERKRPSDLQEAIRETMVEFIEANREAIVKRAQDKLNLRSRKKKDAQTLP